MNESVAIRGKLSSSLNRIFVWCLAITFLSLSIWFVVLRILTPSDGARQEPGGQGITPDGLLITTLVDPPAGLRDGDIVVAVNGLSLNDRLRSLFKGDIPKMDWKFDQVVTYTVLRDGVSADVPVRLGRYPWLRVLRINWSTILVVFISQVVVTLVYLQKPAETAIRALFIWAWSFSHTYAWSFGLQVSDFIHPTGFWLYEICSSILWLIFWGAFISFILSFPEVHPIVRTFPSARIWSYLLPFILSISYTVLSRSGNTPLIWLRQWVVGEWFAGSLIMLLWLVILVEGYRKRFNSVQKKKARWIFLSGSICGSLSLGLYLIPALVTGHPLISAYLLGLILMPFPISLVIAVFRYQLFDVDVVIRRTLAYSILTLVLTGIYFSVVVLLQSIFRRLSGGETDFAITLSTISIAALFRPLRTRIQKSIDQRFYRNKYDAEQALASFAAKLRNETNLASVSDSLVEMTENTLEPTFVRLWLRNPKSEGKG